MKTTNTKRLLILFMAILMVVFAAACDNTPQEGQSTATMAPESGSDATADPNAGPTAEPTATPDPLSGLRYWEIDPDKRIYNILLLGMGQEMEGTIFGHNDTTMILQINLDTNEMRLVSFMRDMLVNIRGEEQRINNSHLIGGPDLVKSIMKSEFGVEIDNYATVNFVTFEQIMRIVGTISINVQDTEVEHLKIARSAVSIEGEMIGGQGVVQAEGTYEFNEYLALSYARDRHSQRVLSDGSIVYNDRGRNERQREVIKAAWEKVKTKPLALIPPSTFMAMTYVETDMSEALVITLLKEMMENNAQILDMSVPESNWPAWKATSGTVYSDDELHDIYNQKKAAYDEANQPAESTGTEGGTTPAPSEASPFPTFDKWREDEGYASVIKWSKNSTLRELHEFLGID